MADKRAYVPFESDSPSQDRSWRPVRVVSSRALPSNRPRRPASRVRRSQQPLAVTDAALRALSAVLEKQNGRATQVLGLTYGDDGLELVLDEPGEGDRLFVWNSATVLFITPSVTHRLTGCVLDHSGVPGAERFSLQLTRNDEGSDLTA